ncbi:uncharacterized protein LOC100197460 [Hydra vulgaris]|uniref:uncharacterized protein LOC100197460 n=1 Tax=Hydra vulgaris TaxID=6087 RepID=UPI001F5FB76D|nr:uncharacterized protein LOC100197460 [Hydra vulgaris]XP_004207567.2 uncharacterized protein LOC100197460 [Hydra vulgaris]XP_047135873.1 uncharacterized protein LOC100197460 [Hydra vulgaris]
MQNGNDPINSEKINEEKASAPPDYFQSQLIHQQTGVNNFQQASNPNIQTPNPMGMNNPQLNQPQAPYPMGMNNPQFNQPQAMYPMGIVNPQFNQPQAMYPMGMNNPQFNQPQQYLNTPQLPINNSNNIVNQPQNSNVININVNQSTKEKTVLVEIPPSHMRLAICSCLCCFWPIGLFAIMKSYEVDSAFAAGDYSRAQQASISARKYARIAIAVGCFVICVIAIIMFTRRSY